MHPILFKFTLPWGLGEHTVGTFGIMVMLGVIAGSLWLSRALKRIGVTDKDAPSDLVTWAVVVGLLGARWTYLAIHPEALQSPIDLIALWKGGIVSYGGFFGGALGAWIWCRRRKLSPRLVGDAMMPALFLGQAFGRIGCFLVGDDYGRPSDLPWAVAFPRGLPPTTVRVHPTQLYEMAALFVVGWLLIRWRRQGVPDAIVLGRYLVLAGTIRFAIEFIRVNQRVLGPLTLAHLVSLALVIAGTALLAAGSRVARVLD